MDHPSPSKDTKKRQHSPDPPIADTETKRQHTNPLDEEGDLLTRLNSILMEINTTPSTGEISADLLGQLRHLMLRIEELAADESNTEARRLKDESDKYLEQWFEDLVAQCDAEGELEWDPTFGAGEEDSDDEESIALAMALQDEEDAVQKDDGVDADLQGNGFGQVLMDDDEGTALDRDDDDLAVTTAQITG
ncbi:hypothetical protein [Absidia glauca]|uniref:Uncharacterized protein n=1 Tax=Absidia glauca TaxID=4829 RepID=A0A168NAX9_ABSGL|nr:hypothetical protein [Absidia glauca]